MKALARLPLPLAAPFLASALLLSTAFAQGPITLVGEGPGQAAPGDTVVYSFRYEIAGEQTGIGVSWSAAAVQFVGAELVAGEGEFLGQDPDKPNVIRWQLEPGIGQITVTLQIPEDFAQPFTVGAFPEGGTAPGTALLTTGVYEPGTEPTVVVPTPQPTPTPPPVTPTPLPTESAGSDTDPLLVVAVALGAVAGVGLLVSGLLLWRERRRGGPS